MTKEHGHQQFLLPERLSTFFSSDDNQHPVLHFCHTRAPSWILSSADNLASSNLQDGATKWLYYAVGTTHPPNPPDQFEISSILQDGATKCNLT